MARLKEGNGSESARALVAGIVCAVSLLVASCPVGAQAEAADPFAICAKQRYALCAAASCLVYNEVAYCACDVKFGTSISVPYQIADGDICAVNRQGYRNGYMMSTYSLPAAVRAGGDRAIYTCRGDTSDGAYAQCDGGFCFTSTRGRRFPGFARRLKANQIVCSCPITVAEPSAHAIGYQIVGPYPCQEAFFDNCTSAVANTSTGSTIAVGAPTGSARALTEILDGSVPALNYCTR